MTKRLPALLILLFAFTSEMTQSQTQTDKDTLALSTAWSASTTAESAQDYATALQQLQVYQNAGGNPFLTSLRAGWLNYLKQDYQKAQAFYLQANRMQPAALNPLLGLLNVAQATSDATGAQRIIESILRIDPLNYRAQMAEASQDLKDHNYQRALTVYRKVLQTYPDDVDARSGEAWALYSFGYKDEAKASFQIILSVNPSYPLAQQGLSLCQNAVASKM